MAEVPRPVRQILCDPVDEASFQRMWRAVGVRRARSWSARDGRQILWLGAPLAAAGIAAAAIVAAWPRAATVSEVRDAGPLRMESAERPVQPLAEILGDVRYDDGSGITPSRGAAIHVVENTGETFATRVDRGLVRFAIEPGGPRRWTVDCGLAVVTVVGTAFEVERSHGRVRIEVTRGRVRVDDRVNERTFDLDAGESATIERVSSDASTAVPNEREQPVEERQPHEARVNRAWSTLAREGEYGRAWELLGHEGLARESRRAGAPDLLALADVARLSGHPAEAVAPLEQLLREHPTDASAGLAAFTLAIVQMDSLSNPAAATHALDRALAHGLPPALQEDAVARLATARGRAGDAEGAARAAASYLERFPDGTHRAEVSRWSR